MNNKILIIAPYQFGELSDCYYWAKYASLEGRQVTYLGYRNLHHSMKERTYKGVRVIGVPHFSNRYLLGLCFFTAIISEILLHRHCNIIACRFPHIEKLLKLFPHRNIILDIRTLSVSPDVTVREESDKQLSHIAKKFKYCTIISEGARNKLEISAQILPVGAEHISKTSKDFSTLKLFYIGAFNNRNLSVFIKGLSLCLKKYNIPFSFDIVGGGSEDEEIKIRQAITHARLNNVTLHGYLTHEEAQIFFDTCNIGVCYVPTTEYYEHQPPTKLYEYLLSGMACIATNTLSNKEVMNNHLGVLTGEDEEEICESLHQMYLQRHCYSSETIVSETRKYHWHNITKDIFLKLFHT